MASKHQYFLGDISLSLSAISYPQWQEETEYITVSGLVTAGPHLAPLAVPALRQAGSPRSGSGLAVLGQLLGDGQEDVVDIQSRLGWGLQEEKSVLLSVGRGLVILHYPVGGQICLVSRQSYDYVRTGLELFINRSLTDSCLLSLPLSAVPSPRTWLSRRCRRWWYRRPRWRPGPPCSTWAPGSDISPGPPCPRSRTWLSCRPDRRSGSGMQLQWWTEKQQVRLAFLGA